MKYSLATNETFCFELGYTSSTLSSRLLRQICVRNRRITVLVIVELECSGDVGLCKWLTFTEDECKRTKKVLLTTFPVMRHEVVTDARLTHINNQVTDW